MDTELMTMTLDELIAYGRHIQWVSQTQLELEQERIQIQDFENRREVEVRTAELLFAVLGDYLSFHAWHVPNYEYRELWDAEVDIEIPQLATIRVKLHVTKDDMDKGHVTNVRLLDRGQGYPFEVLQWSAIRGEDGYYAKCNRYGDGFNDICLALARAAEIGETLEAARARVIELNEQQATKVSEVDLSSIAPTRESLLFKISELLQWGDRYEGEASFQNYQGAIAYGLYVLANEMVRANNMHEGL